MTFRGPIHVGELVDFLASVNHVGKSSPEVGIKVAAQNIRTQVARHVNSASSRWSPSTTTGKPVPVPQLNPSTPDEERRFQAAVLRKQLRAELHERFHRTMAGS